MRVSIQMCDIDMGLSVRQSAGARVVLEQKCIYCDSFYTMVRLYF